MSQLDPRIEVIRKQYDLRADDFWKLPQGRDTWLVKHSAIEVIAAKAGITFDMPEIVQANAADKIAVIIARGFMGDRSEWSFGEATSYNNKNVYPFAMAEKRAKDRVVLKLVGLHGFAYSEEESDEFKTQRTIQPTPDDEDTNRKTANSVSYAQMKRGLLEIDNDLVDCHTVAAVNRCAKSWAERFDREEWTQDYREIGIPKFEKRRKEISSSDAETLIKETFPGAQVTNERFVSTLEAG